MIGGHKMIKIRRHIFLSLIYGILAWSTTIGSLSAAESAFFEQKDEDFWVLRDKRAFTEAARTLIDDEGKWKGQPPVPKFIKFCHKLTKDDLPTLEKWLSLEGLSCFAIADKKEQPNLELIYSWYLDSRDTGENLEQKNLSKLAWLNLETSLAEVEREEQSLLPSSWVETNRAFQMKNCHYNGILSH